MSDLIDTLSDGRFRQLLRHWVAIRGDDMIPCRADVDPLCITACLPHMWIYRLDRARDDFICELAGEEVATVWGKTITGLPAREIMGDSEHDVVFRRWTRVLDTPAVAHSVKRLEGKLRLAERLSLPVRDRDGQLTSVVGMALFSFSEKPAAQSYDASVPMGDIQFYDCRSLQPLTLP